MNRVHLASAASVCIAVLVGGCGGHPVGSTQDGSQEPQPVPAATSEAEIPPSSSAPTVRIGEPGVMSGSMYPGGQVGGDFSVTVAELTCGIKGFDIPADAAYSGSEARRYLAPGGHRYCEADVTVENTGMAPTNQASLGGRLLTDAGKIYNHDMHTTDDVGNSITAENSTSYPGTNTTPELNPGQSAKTAVVWAIPVGSAPTELLLEDVSTVRVVAKPDEIKWLHPKGT